MHRFHRSHIRIRQQGQTLIIALIVMGILLILGLVFLGLINRNIRNAATGQRRSESTDLAEAGVRYAHGQLVTSGLGADWRGTPTTLAESSPNFTGDPDAYYLRPASGLPDDLGGPDRLGPFVRLQFPGGRSLTRVRYGATDATPTALVPGGPLRNPGAARAQLIIESVGRTGVINPRDPTTFNAQGGLQYRGFANVAELTAGIAAMAGADGQIATSRKLTAFAPIGIIDFARFEMNTFNSSAPIEVGIPDGLGATAFNDVAYTANVNNIGVSDVGPNLVLQLGTPGGLGVSANGRDAGRGFGSLMANGDLRFNGRSNVYLNRTLGDGIRVAGRVLGAQGALLNIITTQFNPAANAYQLYNPVTRTYVGTEAAATVSLTDGGAQSFDSQDPSFSTAGGLLLDASPRTDKEGFASGVGRLVPPSILTIDPQTKQNRYVDMTRESGAVVGNGNEGQFGHGRGIYVNNAADRQEPTDAEGRKIVGDQRSLFDDWLNPNSAAAGADSGWVGPFYRPRGAVVQLQRDGWSIQRDGSGPANERTWRRPNGADSTLATVRFRIGRGTDGLLHTVNTLTFADVSRIDADLSPADYSLGQPFNGILYFEGNVRVRGTIPTGAQMTIVSGATIYIEGSILKGTQNNDVTGGNAGASIQGLPTATLMLMAKDNVAVNTPNFFGPTANQALEAVNDTSGATGVSPVRLRAAGGAESGRLDFLTELPLDENSGPNGSRLLSANGWKPYVLNYREWQNAPNFNGAYIPTRILLGETMDDGTAAASFFAMDVNEGPTTSRYLFDAGETMIRNTAADYYSQTSGAIALYGLGVEPWQRYSRFELRSFSLLSNPGTATYNANTGVIGGIASQDYRMFSGSNNILLRPGSIASVPANDTLVARAALAPGDVKIEASIFAEQGSFFVIPGPWFNPNPNDTHLAYAQHLKELTDGGMTAPVAEVRASRDRLEAYGAAPEVPFYGEPLDVRINIVGSVAENLPPPVSVQAEWIRKWGWIPRRLGSTGTGIPQQHVPSGYDIANQNLVPNIVIQYDPILATGRLNNAAQPTVIRSDGFNRPLPPMPRLPVSPKLAYFGEL